MSGEEVADPDGVSHAEGRSGHRGQTPFPKTQTLTSQGIALPDGATPDSEWVGFSVSRSDHEKGVKSIRSIATRCRLFGKAQAVVGLPDDCVVAMYAGSMGAKQGLEIVLEAAQILAAQSPQVHFVICGHGAAYGEISRQSQGLSNVQLLPVQPTDRLNDLLNCADIHLLPQRADAADLVLPSKLTGMFSKGARPVVANAASGTRSRSGCRKCLGW